MYTGDTCLVLPLAVKDLAHERHLSGGRHESDVINVFVCLFVIIFDLAWSRKRDFRQLEHFFFYYLFVLKATQNVM